MDIRQLTSRLDQIENNRLYEGLILTEVKSVKLWENAGRLIKEAALTPDQVQQIFTSIEQGATAAGGNRTMLGKGKDAAAAVNKAWEDLKTKVQNSAPIANVDSAYDSAVAKIEAGLGGPDNAVNQVIQKYRAFAKAHPIAQGLIYSALIAAAGISGAGLGGAAVLGLLKMTDKLLQGEKFSSAAYSGAKTGAMAYGASQLAQHLKGGDNAGNSGPHTKGDTAGGVGTQDATGAPNSDLKITSSNSYAPPTNADGSLMTPQQIAQAKADMASGNTANLSQDQVAALGGGDNPLGITARPSINNVDQPGSVDLPGSDNPLGITARPSINNVDNPGSVDLPGGDNPLGITARPSINNIDQPGSVDLPSSTPDVPINRLTGKPFTNIKAPSWNDMTPDQQADFVATQQQQAADAAQKAQNIKDYFANKSPLTRGLKEGVQLSEKQLSTLFTLIQIKNRQVNEGMWDSIKGAASNAMGAVANKAATVGKNLTTKITADKLNSAWKKAGSPTDSEQVAQVLQGAGADPTLVSKAFTDLGIPAPTGEIQDPPMSKDEKSAPGSASPETNTAASAGQPDELDAIKKNAGLPVVNIKDLLAQIIALTPADQQQVLAYLKK